MAVLDAPAVEEKKKTEPAVVDKGSPEPAVVADAPARDAVDEPARLSERPPHDVGLALEAHNWHLLFERTKLSGISRNLLANCCVETMEEPQLGLILDVQQSALLNDDHRQRIIESLRAELGEHWQIRVRVGELLSESPAQRRQRLLEESRQKAFAEFHNDPHVVSLIESFSATLVPDSIQFMSEK